MRKSPASLSVAPNPPQFPLIEREVMNTDLFLIQEVIADAYVPANLRNSSWLRELHKLRGA